MMGSRRVTTYVERGEEYRVVVQADAEGRANERDLTNVYVRSRSDALVPLSNLVSFRDAADARELGRYNKMRAITLTGSLASGYTLGERSEEHTSELQSLMRISYAVFCLKKKNTTQQ